jgi:glycosyltransferase involved in cell wall biosynthesis
MIENISVVIIVKNGERTIKATLDAVQKFSDVVVYDNDSSDNTLKIVKSYANVNLIQGEFLGFGQTKNKATMYAKNDWILSLDADEVVTSDLLNYLTLEKLDENFIYSIFRKNFYQKRQIRHCWKNDIIVRLFNKKQTNFNDNILHEFVVESGLKIKELKGVVEHYPYANISAFLQKTDRYSELYAKQNRGKKSSPFIAWYKSIFHFIKLYFLKMGFLDGYAGFLISASGASGVFFKYLKLYELNKTL